MTDSLVRNGRPRCTASSRLTERRPSRRRSTPRCTRSSRTTSRRSPTWTRLYPSYASNRPRSLYPMRLVSLAGIPDDEACGRKPLTRVLFRIDGHSTRGKVRLALTTRESCRKHRKGGQSRTEERRAILHHPSSAAPSAVAHCPSVRCIGLLMTLSDWLQGRAASPDAPLDSASAQGTAFPTADKSRSTRSPSPRVRADPSKDDRSPNPWLEACSRLDPTNPLLVAAVTAATLVGGSKVWKRYGRRIRNADSLKSEDLQGGGRRLRGYVTR